MKVGYLRGRRAAPSGLVRCRPGGPNPPARPCPEGRGLAAAAASAQPGEEPGNRGTSSPLLDDVVKLVVGLIVLQTLHGVPLTLPVGLPELPDKHLGDRRAS